MLQRIVVVAILIGAAYWYWSGPWQREHHPDYAAIVQQNDEKMAECTRAAAYKLGATGVGAGAEVATRNCAEKYNLYEEDGHWHSYSMSRPK